ncbi:MAG: NADH-quinone oxidoreductase subunit H [Candidatus Parvarchaeota archaeon]|nr:NADH-quinone oxidoreductase subunit H [Candidatus Rehaiarchaeum fermentans]
MSIFDIIYKYILSNGFGYLSLPISIILTLIIALIITAVVPLFVSGWIERKVAARIQSRRGPIFAGKFGLLQNLFDAIKMLGKEIIRNEDADKLFLLPSILYGTVVLLLFLIVPLGNKNLAILNVSDNLLLTFILFSYLGLIAILGGIFSGNKFASISAYREGVKTFAFEGIVLLSIFMIGYRNSFSFQNINSVNIIYYPLIAISFLIGIISMIDRGPLDVTNAEQELIGGWRIEYSGLVYGLPLLGDYSLAFIASMIFSILFLGGAGSGILSFIIFWIKTFIVFFILILLRWLYPRPRIDQLINFSWKYIFPLTILNAIIIWMI